MSHPSIRRDVICSNCGNEFDKPRSKAARQDNHFCDRECFNEWHTGENNHQFSKAKAELSCDECGETFERYRSKINESNFCSQECKAEFARKDKWDDGFYQSSQWETKREEIRKRDDQQCVWCGSSDEELHVHHLRPISAGGSKLDDKNLITLCQQCHTVAHKALSE